MHLAEHLILRMVNNTIKKAQFIKIELPNSGKIKILLIGYNGKRNVGAEIRAAEIVSTLNESKLKDKIEISVLTFDVEASKPYYKYPVHFITMSSIFFNDLLFACSNHHLGMLVEGSCLTSVTSNVAAMFFICAAGVLKAQDKLCIAYGVEAGHMPKILQKYAELHCSATHFIARTELSLKNFKKYNLNCTLGTDTAWNYKCFNIKWAEDELKKLGVTLNTQKLVGISPINAFIRPITPKFLKYLKGKLFNKWNDHYNKFYFYTNNKSRKRRYQKYIELLAQSFNELWIKDNTIVPVIIEMEPMDKNCTCTLKNMLCVPPIIISASNYSGSEMTGLLNCLEALLSSRYHAHVLSMKTGVPCIAISKDQRLHTIFLEHEFAEYCVSTHDDTLLKIPELLTKLWDNRSEIRSKLLTRQKEYELKQDKMNSQVITLITNRMHIT